jgi:hypothetical protein
LSERAALGAADFRTRRNFEDQIGYINHIVVFEIFENTILKGQPWRYSERKGDNQ